MENKGKKTRKFFKILLVLVLLAMMVYSGTKLWLYMREARNSRDALDSMTEIAVRTETEDAAKEPPIEVDLKALQALYPDLAAWLYSPDTPINLPVMQAPDNSYYLDKLPDGSYNAAGSIFMDCRNRADFSDRNTVLYGHHMKNGTMFASLTRYSSQEYYDAHPVMYLFTPEAVYRVEVFAGCVVPSDHTIYYPKPAMGETGPVDEIRRSSPFVSQVELKEDDRIITLSTCSFDYDEARYVILGRLVALPEAEEQTAGE